MGFVSLRIVSHCNVCWFPQFPYKVDIPLVTLIVEDEWREVSDAVAAFKVTPNYSRSSWDWIGLYKVLCLNRKCIIFFYFYVAINLQISIYIFF